MNRTLLTLLLLFFSFAWFDAIADELSSSLLFTAKMDGATEVPSVVLVDKAWPYSPLMRKNPRYMYLLR